MLKTVGGFRYIEALCPLSWKVYGNESTVQTCMDQILTLQRDARAGVSRPNSMWLRACLDSRNPVDE